MAEPEELIGEAIRFVAARVQGRWSSHATRPRPDPGLAQFAPRLELLTLAVTGQALQVRPARSPLPPTLLARVFRNSSMPWQAMPLPATDGMTLWLPPVMPAGVDAFALYRAMTLQQAVRALRGSALIAQDSPSVLVRELLIVLETIAADWWLADHLPGTAPLLVALRMHALMLRPALTRFRGPAQALELIVRRALVSPLRTPPEELRPSASATASLHAAIALAACLRRTGARADEISALYPDWWTGQLESPPGPVSAAVARDPESDTKPTRSARLRNAPRVRPSSPDEVESDEPGPWAVQPDTPHEHIEDPHGMQRPADRDNVEDTEQLAEAVSDLDSARLVRSPGQAREVLLSEAVLPAHVAGQAAAVVGDVTLLHYPEWDYRTASYGSPGTTVRCAVADVGDNAWVTRTLDAYRSQLASLRRSFEQLRARRVTLRRQVDGTEPDLDACIADRADVRAGLPRTQALYLQIRPARRDLAILLLVDVSGSTDSWIAGARRVIDVEREALLLVCVALDALGEPYAVLSFSGESAAGVDVKAVKGFDEPIAGIAWRRIAALEPDRYTRVGAALRHASAMLARKPAAHRLLLLLSDGKPNDVDQYDGVYGVHDFRRAILEARACGIHPFCLTVDREAAGYLRGVFGTGGYALLQQPERLPLVMLDWLRRLIAT